MKCVDSVNDKFVDSVDRHKPTSYNEVDGTKYTEEELIFPPELLLKKPTFLNLTGFGGLIDETKENTISSSGFCNACARTKCFGS